MAGGKIFQTKTVDPTDPSIGGKVYQVTQVDPTDPHTQGMVYQVVNVGGGSATIEELNVTPSTSAQTIEATSSVDGYAPVNVAAVTSSIDANIVAGNIKKDITILGVTGSYDAGGSTPIIDELNVTPSTSAQVITAPTGTDGYSPINVSAVDASIDANITAGNIKSGVTILGVTGNVVELNGETKTVTPQVYGQTLYPTSPKNAITEVSVSAVTSSIDANIQAGNIKSGVQILGVTGTYSGGGASGRVLEYEVDNGVLTHSTTANTIIDLTGVTEIRKNYMLAYAYENNTAVSGTADLSSVKYIGGYCCYYMFAGATNITYGDLSSLENIGNTGYGCSMMFSNTGLVTLDLRKLIATNGSYVFGSVAAYCSNLTTVRLDSLRELWGANSFNSAFENCTALQVLRFPALKLVGSRNNYLDNMLAGVTGCVVHFPSNMQSVIGSWSSVTNGFNGTNTTILWDLPATVILTGVNSTNYERNPQYDTATALAWRVENPDYATNVTVDWTPYYTSGTTDPAVSDTIYSDAACTTPVTTISSIA